MSLPQPRRRTYPKKKGLAQTALTLEAQMELLIAAWDLPSPIRELEFHPARKWRFDFAWPEHMLALEVEGGVWSSGRHVRPAGYEEDVVKYNEALLLGWRVIRATTSHVESGIAAEWLQRALGTPRLVTEHLADKTARQREKGL